MELDGRHCESEERQFHSANRSACQALLIRLREIHGTPVLPHEPDVIDIAPVVFKRKSEASETVAESRFIRYRTDENGQRMPMVAEIKSVVSEFFDISPLNLDSRSRKAKFVWPRQIAMYLSSTLTLRSLPDIGRRFGGRDHTTVLHAVRKIERLVAEDPETADLINDLKEELNDDGGAAVLPDETAAPAHQAAL